MSTEKARRQAADRLKAIYEARHQHWWPEWLMPVVALTLIVLLLVGIPLFVVWSIVDAPPYFWQDQGPSTEEQYDPTDRQTR